MAKKKGSAAVGAGKRRTIVFDLDGTLETPYFNKSKSECVKAWMDEHPCGYAFDDLYAELDILDQNLPHFFFNGAFELLRWVQDHGFEIVFFSNAVKERNAALCPMLMERAFAGREIPPYRILSRDDCVDARNPLDRTDRKELQGLWRGNYKKKLAGVVVSDADLPNTVMIEDDNSYAAKGEEQNFVYGVYGGGANTFIERPELSEYEGQDFHLPFYLCGMLSRIVRFAEKKGVSLADAAVQVQYSDYGLVFPRDGEVLEDSQGGRIEPPCPPARDLRIFLEGLNELRTYNPGLKFWGGEVGDNDWRWPDPDRPPPPPPKPKVKTDMTMKEAHYWMCRLQNALRVIGTTNVKLVSLRGDDYKTHVSYGEGDGYTSPRLREFEADERSDFFDRTKVTTFHMYGYLPIRQEEPKGDRYSYFGNLTYESNVKYRIFFEYIEEFLWQVFNLRICVNRWEFKPSDYETWDIPVKYEKPRF